MLDTTFSTHLKSCMCTLYGLPTNWVWWTCTIKNIYIFTTICQASVCQCILMLAFKGIHDYLRGKWTNLESLHPLFEVFFQQGESHNHQHLKCKHRDSGLSVNINGVWLSSWNALSPEGSCLKEVWLYHIKLDQTLLTYNNSDYNKFSTSVPQKIKQQCNCIYWCQY